MLRSPLSNLNALLVCEICGNINCEEVSSGYCPQQLSFCLSPSSGKQTQLLSAIIGENLRLKTLNPQILLPSTTIFTFLLFPFNLRSALHLCGEFLKVSLVS